MHSNTMQGADYLAKLSGNRILLPDFFRGKSWPVDNIPPKEGRPFLNNWIQTVGSWEKIRPSLLATIEYLKANNTNVIGVSYPRYATSTNYLLLCSHTRLCQAYGFCFGAKKLMQGAHENLFRSMALVHPSFFQPDDADNVAAPIALIPSGGEDKDVMNAFWERIQQKPIAAKSIRQDFVSCLTLTLPKL